MNHAARPSESSNSIIAGDHLLKLVVVDAIDMTTHMSSIRNVVSDSGSSAFAVLSSVVFWIPLEYILIRQHFQSSICCWAFRSNLNCHTIHKCKALDTTPSLLWFLLLAHHSCTANCSTPQSLAPANTWYSMPAKTPLRAPS
jgi:hypothetical protein